MPFGSKVPDDLYYTKNHQWLKVEDELVRIGLSEYGKGILGYVLHVELTSEEEVEKTATDETETSKLFEIESMKSTTSFNTPLSGEVVEINRRLEDKPDLINTDPYGKGWICVFEPNDIEEVESLLDSEAYIEHLKSLERG